MTSVLATPYPIHMIHGRQVMSTTVLALESDAAPLNFACSPGGEPSTLGSEFYQPSKFLFRLLLLAVWAGRGKSCIANIACVFLWCHKLHSAVAANDVAALFGHERSRGIAECLDTGRANAPPGAGFGVELFFEFERSEALE